MEYKGVKPKTILVKVTSRERPNQLINSINKCLDLAQNPTALKWLISLDHNDPTNSVSLTQSLNLANSTIVVGSSTGKINAINRDINEYKEHWDILVNLSDDQFAVQSGWDEIIREKMPNDLDHTLWFYDGLQNNINTMEIVGYNYYQRFKYLYHPSYNSFYPDEENTHVGKKLNRIIKDNRMLFKHEHPAGNRAIPNDDLYDRNQKYWNEDKANFLNRWQHNFGV